MKDKIDEIFGEYAKRGVFEGTTIACLYTGKKLPSKCASMPLEPQPELGVLLDKSFAVYFAAALALNQAVHDGAIMFGRSDPNENYRVTGWSYRLFPIEGGVVKQINRGSAFHSCQAMSLTPTVDRVYILSESAIRFIGGVSTSLTSGCV